VDLLSAVSPARHWGKYIYIKFNPNICPAPGIYLSTALGTIENGSSIKIFFLKLLVIYLEKIKVSKGGAQL
jgi:hypothetical protein